jgi:hypothetical protein
MAGAWTPDEIYLVAKGLTACLKKMGLATEHNQSLE